MFFLFWAVLTLGGSVDSFILPLTKPDGSLNVPNLVNHMNLLDQSLANVQSQMKSQLASTSGQMALLQSQLQTTLSDLASLRTEMTKNQGELTTTRAELNTTKTEQTLLKKQMKKNQGEITSVKDQCTQKQNSTAVSLQNLDAKLEKDLTKLNTSLSGDMDDVRNVLKNLSTSDHHIQQILSQTSQRVSSVQTTCVSLRTKVTHLAATVNTLTKEISFEARFSNRNVTYRPFQTLVFSLVSLNMGSGYNPRTGVFKAPVTGTYLLWGQLAKNYLLEVIVYAGNRAVQTLESFTTGMDNMSFTNAIHLRAGETVYIKVVLGTKIIKGKFGGTLLRAH